MNIKSRLKTIESKMSKSNSGYCACYGTGSKYESRLDRNAPGMVSRMPDFCDKCRKQVDKRSIEIIFDEHRENVRQRRTQVEATRKMFED